MDGARGETSLGLRARLALVALGLVLGAAAVTLVAAATHGDEWAVFLDPANPDARVAYVDYDPVVVSHGNALLTVPDRSVVAREDIRRPRELLANPAIRGHLDFSRPVALTLLAILHFVPDEDDPAAVVEAYHRATVSGSLLAVSHATNDYEPERLEEMEDVYRGATAGLTGRSHKEIVALLGPYDLVPPGLVSMIDWRPDPASGPDPLGGDVRRYSSCAVMGIHA